MGVLSELPEITGAAEQQLIVELGEMIQGYCVEREISTYDATVALANIIGILVANAEDATIASKRKFLTDIAELQSSVMLDNLEGGGSQN